MKILVTGVSGFLGSHLINYLDKNSNYELFGVIRRKNTDAQIEELISAAEIFSLEEHSICEIVSKIKPDIVIHAAASSIVSQSFDDVKTLIQSNIEFPTQLLEAMAINGVNKLINTGTNWQHYNSALYDPVNLYAATKEAFEKIITYYVNAKKFCAITLKLFDTYGPKDKRKKIIQLLDNIYINSAELDMSAGEQEIDLVHIDDICFAYLVAIDEITKNNQINKHQSYAVKGKERMTLKELVKTYENANTTKLKIKWGKRPYREREVFKLVDNLETLPNWKAKIKLIDGLKIENRN